MKDIKYEKPKKRSKAYLIVEATVGWAMIFGVTILALLVL